MSKVSKTELATDLFVEALEAAIHTIICIRGVYPKNIFERRMLYGTPVYLSRHPALCQYIASVLLNMKTLLISKQVEKLVVAIYSEESNQLLETYNFQVFQIGESPTDQDVVEDQLLHDLEIQFRDLLLRMMSLDWQLQPIQGDTRFSLLVHLCEQEASQSDTSLNQNNNEVYGPLRTGNWLLATDHESFPGTAGGKVTPLRSVKVPGLHFQVFCASQT